MWSVDGEVVDRGVRALAKVACVADSGGGAVGQEDAVADPDVARFGPASAVDPDGVADCGSEGLGADVEGELDEVLVAVAGELDAWVCRHAEPDDQVASRQPVTDATTHHLRLPV